MNNPLREYLWSEWKKNNHSKYWKYFEEWFNNITPNQRIFFIAWSKGNKTVV